MNIPLEEAFAKAAPRPLRVIRTSSEFLHIGDAASIEHDVRDKEWAELQALLLAHCYNGLWDVVGAANKLLNYGFHNESGDLVIGKEYVEEFNAHLAKASAVEFPG